MKMGRTEWALSYRLDRPTRGNFTNNYAEAGIRVLKEIIFGRVKAYNLVQMFEFIVSIMENTIPTAMLKPSFLQELHNYSSITIAAQALQ